jgi:hypothetical protein
MESLENYVLYRVRKQLNDTTKSTVDIALSVTLPCGCCSERRFYSEDKEGLLGSSDAQLINNFEMVSQTFLNQASDWYCHNDNDSISIDLS